MFSACIVTSAMKYSPTERESQDFDENKAKVKVFFFFFFFFFLIQFYVPFKIISAHMRRANQ